MIYETSASYSGDPRLVMQSACDALSAADMRITTKTDTTIEFTGPKLNSSKENPVRGISNGRLSVTGSSISIKADLSCITRLITILACLFGGMEILGIVVVAIVMRHSSLLPMMLGILIGSAAPWIVLLPLMSRWMKRRTTRAIDTLLNNLSVAARLDAQHSLPRKSSVS